MAASFNRKLSGVIIAIAVMFCSSVRAAEIPWSTNIEDALHRAAANGQPVLMEFTADWCVFCKKMEKNTFPNPQVTHKISGNFVAVRVDADQNKGLVKDLGIKGLPAILIVSPDLKVIKRISGFQTPEALIKQLDEVTSAIPTPAAPAMIANSNVQPQRSTNPPVRKQPPQQQQPQFDRQQQPRIPQQNGFQPDAVATTRPKRGELEFEAISQEEAPRAGAPRTQNRPSPEPKKHQLFDVPGSRIQQPVDLFEIGFTLEGTTMFGIMGQIQNGEQRLGLITEDQHVINQRVKQRLIGIPRLDSAEVLVPLMLQPRRLIKPWRIRHSFTSPTT